MTHFKPKNPNGAARCSSSSSAVVSFFFGARGSGRVAPAPAAPASPAWLAIGFPRRPLAACAAEHHARVRAQVVQRAGNECLADEHRRRPVARDVVAPAAPQRAVDKNVGHHRIHPINNQRPVY